MFKREENVVGRSGGGLLARAATGFIELLQEW